MQGVQKAFEDSRAKFAKLAGEKRRIELEIADTEAKLAEKQAKQKRDDTRQENQDRQPPAGKITTSITGFSAGTTNLALGDGPSFVWHDLQTQTRITYTIHQSGGNGGEKNLVEEGGSLSAAGSVSLKGLQVVPLKSGKGTVTLKAGGEKKNRKCLAF